MCFVNLYLALVKENGHLNHTLLTTFFYPVVRSTVHLSLSLSKIIVVILTRTIFPPQDIRLRGLTAQGNKSSVHV